MSTDFNPIISCASLIAPAPGFVSSIAFSLPFFIFHSLMPFPLLTCTEPLSVSIKTSAKGSPILTGPLIPSFLFSPAAQTPYAHNSIALSAEDLPLFDFP